MNEELRKAVCIHMPQLLPQYYEFNISLTIQSSACFAVGLLYKKSKNKVISEFLLSQLMRKPLNDKDLEREGMALASGLALGIINLSHGQSSEIDCKLLRLIKGGTRPKPSKILEQFLQNSEHCSGIQEGNFVNTLVTTPGALMALAFIYLKSNNKIIARNIQIPDSLYALEHEKADFFTLKIIAKNLIMWDKIENTVDWNIQQIPEAVRIVFTQSIQEIETRFGNITNLNDIDLSGIQNLYFSSLIGTFLIQAIKYSGSGDIQLASNILKLCKELRQQKAKSCPELICYGCLSASIIMSGSGDISVMKYIRQVRKIIDQSNYGLFSIINQALGFLFLGQGLYGFKHDDFSIACLTISILPYIPTSPSDNRYYLQALRHIYVLGIKSNILQICDVDTNQLVELEVWLQAQKLEYIRKAPLLLPTQISKITVQDSNYWNLQVDTCNMLYVKKKLKNINYYDNFPLESGKQNLKEILKKILKHKYRSIELTSRILSVYLKAQNMVHFQEMDDLEALLNINEQIIQEDISCLLAIFVARKSAKPFLI